MKKECLEFYQYFDKITETINDYILSAYKNNKIKLASKESLSLLISECLKEDIDTIEYLKDNNFKSRYTDAIIRNMSEQVIEYLYIMKHQELIEIYFGKNLKGEWNQEDLIKGLKQTGQARFGKRESIKNMARDIGELDSNDEKLSLYDIFSLKAELEHNSYFHHIFDIIGEIEEPNDKREKDSFDYILIIYILTVFLDKYNDISEDLEYQE